MYRALRAPISVQVEMTQRCNSSCVHCYNHWRTEQATAYLSAENVRRIVHEIVANEVFDVTITGGEPLLRPEETILMMQLLHRGGVNFTMNSNLRLLTPQLATRLREAGLRTVLTSFVSHDPEHHAVITQSKNSYKQVIRGIGVAQEVGLKVAANMVLSKLNVGDLPDTARFLFAHGVRNFCATKVSPPSDLRDVQYLLLTQTEIRESLAMLVELEAELGINVDILECYPLCLVGDGRRFGKFFRRTCVAGISACTIGSDGAVRPCSHASSQYGNILSESLSCIWRKMDDWRNGSYIPTTCKTCAHLHACTGGCRIDAYAHGDLCGMDPSAIPDQKSNVVYPEQPRIDDVVLYSLLPFNSRKEEFGRVIFSQKACFPVNEAGFSILDGLRASTFTLEAFTGQARDFLRHMVVLGFARPASIQKESAS